MSDVTDFRDLLADVPLDGAPEPPVRQGRRVKPLAAHDREANNCFFCETSNPTNRSSMLPMVQITGQRRPDRGTIGRSGANPDYRMSTNAHKCPHMSTHVAWMLVNEDCPVR